jgi:hypothetical protein
VFHCAKLPRSWPMQAATAGCQLPFKLGAVGGGDGSLAERIAGFLLNG